MKNHEDFFEQLREKGLRLTRARMAVITLLARVDAPQSIPEILDALREMGSLFNKTTLYRELAFLVGHGMVKEVIVSGEKRYYELVGDHHHHTVCLGCGSIRDIIFRENLLHIERAISEQEGFQVLEHSLEFFGFCRTCKV
ncbi:MAG: transcriptional repressor [Candidatus Moranbacteria bacterium]|jgi:Fe2+ or Zn2+ uptake regulation protein|nr:transcriptional repressor [Candidatus Moranbacteria bacterium]MBP9801240.1 transcriptional repressor [Candidatus Moranbacteria bacterium]